MTGISSSSAVEVYSYTLANKEAHVLQSVYAHQLTDDEKYKLQNAHAENTHIPSTTRPRVFCVYATTVKRTQSHWRAMKNIPVNYFLYIGVSRAAICIWFTFYKGNLGTEHNERKPIYRWIRHTIEMSNRNWV